MKYSYIQYRSEILLAERRQLLFRFIALKSFFKIKNRFYNKNDLNDTPAACETQGQVNLQKCRFCALYKKISISYLYMKLFLHLYCTVQYIHSICTLQTPLHIFPDNIPKSKHNLNWFSVNPDFFRSFRITKQINESKINPLRPFVHSIPLTLYTLQYTLVSIDTLCPFPAMSCCPLYSFLSSISS